MALQTKVYTSMASALPGMPASTIETHYLALTPLASADITVGNFVFADTTTPSKVSPSGTGMVRGIAVFVRNYVAAGFAPTMKIPAGAPVTVATNGKFWVTCTNTSPAVGHYVFASQTDGSVSTAAANTTQSGKTLTNFVVEAVTGTTANSLILISNQTPTVVATAAAGGVGG